MKRWMAAPATAVKTVLTRPLVLGLNVAGMPALVAGLWAWLYIPVSNIPMVLLSVLLLLLLVLGLLVLMAYTYNCYYAAQHPLHPVSSKGIRLPETPLLKRSLRALPALLLWFAVFGVLCMSVTWVNAYTLDGAKTVASWLTMLSQKPVTFYSVNSAFEWILDGIRWLVLPLVFFASFAGFTTAALRKGRKRAWLNHSLRNLRNPLYWGAWIAFAVLGLWLPGKLVAWVPTLEGIPVATVSMLLRFGIALLVATVGWLLFLSLLARLTKQPRESLIVVAGEARSRPA